MGHRVSHHGVVEAAVRLG